MEISISATQENESMELWRLQTAAFLPLYERYHDEGNVCLRGVEDVSERLNSDTARYFTVFSGGEIVGGILYKCKGSAPFFERLEEGEYYLHRVYIKPEFQGKRIAQTAILLSQMEFPDAKRFLVDFPEDLAKNRRCYEKAGFVDTGKRLQVQENLILACYEKNTDK